MDNYTFMRMGNLYQATMDVMIAACKRFGAENAEKVIGEITYEVLKKEKGTSILLSDIHDLVFSETQGKVSITMDDVIFVGNIIDAEQSIKSAIEQLNKAIKPEEKNNGK